MKIQSIYALILLQTIVFAAPAFPCSAVSIKSDNGVFDGRNLDWDYGHGLLIANPRNLKKTALLGAPFTRAEWLSKYGSLTFNQAGRELPYGGINEKGLDVEALWLRSAIFPKQSSVPTVNELQWVQYQLDNYSSTKEVLENLNKISVTNRFAKIHYFVCDASGSCAAIDPIDGKLVVHSQDVAALTNDTYEDSLKYTKQFSSNNRLQSLPGGTKSLARFARLNFLLKTSTGSAIDNIFSDLSAVSSSVSNDDDDKTQWSIAIELNKKIVHWKTASNPKDKFIDLSKIDFDCKHVVQVLDINDSNSGNLTNHLHAYTKDLDKSIVEKSLSTGFAHLPSESIQKVLDYPDRLTCQN